MKITLAGATGFLGARLVSELSEAGHELSVLGRHKSLSLPSNARFTTWDATRGEPPPESVAGAGAVINLVGEPVARRWNDEVKIRIRASRVEGTRNLVRALSKVSPPPSVLVNASAIGYYGSRGDEILTEQSPAGSDFLANLTKDWEAAADSAEQFGTRVVKVRIGIVLGREGGALAQMLLPFRFGLGGRLASGQQWMSWIHLDDVVGLMMFAMRNEAVRGPLNATALNPARNSEFTAELGRVLHRPAILPVPAIAIRALFGEMADFILASQRVLPKVAEGAGYRFRFTDLRSALQNILSSREGA
jgi:uncharacterized protein (TIGR01777 family)